MKTNPLRLAMVQMLVDGGAREANLRRAEARLAEAADHQAQLVLLPEALDLGWTHPSAERGAAPIPDGYACRRLRRAARQFGLFVCAGLTERAGAEVFNAAVLIGPGGELLLHHRKLNELKIGQASYALGDRLSVAKVPWGRVGLMICADGFARGQVISRALGLMGAGLVLSPCAWAVPADHDNARQPYGQLWRDNYGRVARDFQMWIAGCSNVGPIAAGPWAGRRCIGCSLLVGPDGEPVAQGPYGEAAETILYADLELPPRPAQGDDWERWWSENGTDPLLR